MSDDPLADALADMPSPDAPAAAPPPGAAPPGAPVSPRGGPLRGQRLTPAPAPGPAPAPPSLSLGDAIQQAQKNLLPSAASNISNTMHALAPWNWAEDARGLNQLGVGLESKLGLIDQGDPAEQAKDEAAVNAVGKMYGDRYGSWEGFKRTLANDPFAIGSDIASVATLPLGGEGMLSKIPDAADALGAARVAGAMRTAGSLAKPVLTRARWLDPAYAGSQVLGKTVNAGRALTRTPVIGKAIRGAAGAAAGNVIGGFVPIIGHTGGTIIGEHLAENLGSHPPGWLSKGLEKGRGIVPAATTVGGTEAMPASEQAQQGGGPPAAPGAAPGAPPPTADQGGGDDPFAAAMADSGLEGPVTPAAAPTPSSGLQGAPPEGAPMGAPRGAQYDRIAQIATNSGATPAQVAILQHIAKVESGGNPNATSPSGRYHGAFQYQNSAGLEADTQRALGDLQNNAQKLARMGVTPDAGALYVMHQQGAGGGPALLTAPPGTPAIDAIARFYGSRAVARQAIAHNIGINYKTPAGEAEANARAESMTAQDFVNLWRRRLGTAAATGGRIGRAEGGNVVDMTEALMRRAEAHHKATQQATKPLLSVDDTTIAKALKVAQAGI